MNKEYNFTCALFYPVHSWCGEELWVGSQDLLFTFSAVVSPVKKWEERAWYFIDMNH